MASNVVHGFDALKFQDTYEVLRREALKISHRLAFNCKQYLETIDSARVRSGVAKLQLKGVSVVHDV